MRKLGESNAVFFLFLVLIKGMKKGGECKISLRCLNVWVLPLSLFPGEVEYLSACGVSVDDKANGGRFGG